MDLALGEANFMFRTQALLCQIVHKYGVFLSKRAENSCDITQKLQAEMWNTLQ